MKIATKFVGLMLIALLALGAAAGAQEHKPTEKGASTAKEHAAAKKVVDEADEGEKEITKKDVPAPVLAAFAKAYPKATVQGYAQEMEKGQTAYEVSSVEGKMTRYVLFAADGKVLVVEESMEMKDVPDVVRQALEKKFPKAKVNLVEKVTEGNSVGYEFKLTTAAGKKAEVKFDANGKEEKP